MLGQSMPTVNPYILLALAALRVEGTSSGSWVAPNGSVLRQAGHAPSSHRAVIGDTIILLQYPPWVDMIDGKNRDDLDRIGNLTVPTKKVPRRSALMWKTERQPRPRQFPLTEESFHFVCSAALMLRWDIQWVHISDVAMYLRRSSRLWNSTRRNASQDLEDIGCRHR